jgi:hypothetical protein
MGLDQWLYAKKFIWRIYDKDIAYGDSKVLEAEINKLLGIKSSIGEVKYIAYEVICWRKANAIHSWFVEHVQEGKDDCETYYVSMEQLEELYKTIGEVLSNHGKAEELLNSKGGFFFGSTAFDEYYFDDLQRTYTKLGEIIHDKEDKYKGMSFEYSSSW